MRGIEFMVFCILVGIINLWEKYFRKYLVKCFYFNVKGSFYWLIDFYSVYVMIVKYILVSYGIDYKYIFY